MVFDSICYWVRVGSRDRVLLCSGDATPDSPFRGRVGHAFSRGRIDGVGGQAGAFLCFRRLGRFVLVINEGGSVIIIRT